MVSRKIKDVHCLLKKRKYLKNCNPKLALFIVPEGSHLPHILPRSPKCRAKYAFYSVIAQIRGTWISPVACFKYGDFFIEGTSHGPVNFPQYAQSIHTHFSIYIFIYLVIFYL